MRTLSSEILQRFKYRYYFIFKGLLQFYLKYMINTQLCRYYIIYVFQYVLKYANKQQNFEVQNPKHENNKFIYQIIKIKYIHFHDNQQMSQIKLCQVISSQAVNQKGFALLQSIKNSFKRNKILFRLNTLSGTGSANKEICVNLSKKDSVKTDNQITSDLNYSRRDAVAIIVQYQTQLTSFNFRNQDLPILLEYIYSKDVLSVSDRNLLRRVLLSVFDQDFIVKGGGRMLIQNLVFQHLEKGRKIKMLNQERKFYLLLRGKLRVRTPIYSKQFVAGSFFGELQISNNSNDNIQQIKALSECILFKVSVQFFMITFHKYFVIQNQEKQNYLENCGEFLQAVLPVIKSMFISQLSMISFKTGVRIIKKGDPCQKIYFIGKQKISNTQNRVINKYRVLGLLQIIQQRQNYCQNIYSMGQIKVFQIQRKRFEQYFDIKILSRLTKSLAEELALSTLGQIAAKEVLSIKRFMNIRKVKLPLKKRQYGSHTNNKNNATANLIVSNFSTLKDEQLKDTQTHINEFIFIPKQNRIKKKLWSAKKGDYVTPKENFSQYRNLNSQGSAPIINLGNEGVKYIRSSEIQRCVTYGCDQLNNPQVPKLVLPSPNPKQKNQMKNNSFKKNRETLTAIRQMLTKNNSPKAKIQEYRVLSKSIERDLFVRMQRKLISQFNKQQVRSTIERKNIDSSFIKIQIN